MSEMLPFIEAEAPCLVCGRMVLQPRKRAGRRRRFCSTECKAKRLKLWKATWQAKELAKGGGLKVCKGRGVGPVGAFVPKTSELNTKSHLPAPLMLKITCIECGTAFPLERTGMGRLPRICSAACSLQRRNAQSRSARSRAKLRRQGGGRVKSPEG